MDWRDDAACVDLPLDLFFPDGRVDEQVAYAKQVCADCPVLDDCRAFALRTRPEFGVFGGLSPHDRRKILAVRRAA